ncbi:MAG: hypothetical protein ACOY71_08915 [Gemmatimonadota bacterium]
MATAGVAEHGAAVLCLLGGRAAVAGVARVHEVALAREVDRHFHQLGPRRGQANQHKPEE